MIHTRSKLINENPLINEDLITRLIDFQILVLLKIIKTLFNHIKRRGCDEISRELSCMIFTEPTKKVNIMLMCLTVKCLLNVSPNKEKNSYLYVMTL